MRARPADYDSDPPDDGEDASASDHSSDSFGPPPPPELTAIITEAEGDVFDAKPFDVLIQSCNSKGAWGQGLAKEFKLRYPQAHKIYKKHCIVHPTDKSLMYHQKSILGTSLLIYPLTPNKRTRKGQAPVYIACLFTSHGYGKDASNFILVNQFTRNAMKMLDEQLKILRVQGKKIGEIRSNRINSEIFGVDWYHTRRIYEEGPLDVTVLRPLGQPLREAWEEIKLRWGGFSDLWLQPKKWRKPKLIPDDDAESNENNDSEPNEDDDTEPNEDDYSEAGDNDDPEPSENDDAQDNPPEHDRSWRPLPPNYEIPDIVDRMNAYKAQEGWPEDEVEDQAEADEEFYQAKLENKREREDYFASRGVIHKKSSKWAWEKGMLARERIEHERFENALVQRKIALENPVGPDSSTSQDEGDGGQKPIKKSGKAKGKQEPKKPKANPTEDVMSGIEGDNAKEQPPAKMPTKAGKRKQPKGRKGKRTEDAMSGIEEDIDDSQPSRETATRGGTKQRPRRRKEKLKEDVMSGMEGDSDEFEPRKKMAIGARIRQQPKRGKGKTVEEVTSDYEEDSDESQSPTKMTARARGKQPQKRRQKELTEEVLSSIEKDNDDRQTLASKAKLTTGTEKRQQPKREKPKVTKGPISGVQGDNDKEPRRSGRVVKKKKK